MKKVRKFLTLTVTYIVLLFTIVLLTGCLRPIPTKLHEWNGANYWGMTDFIYEVRSTPTEKKGKTLLWDLNNVKLYLYFGWDANKNQNKDVSSIICYAAYFFWNDNVWPDNGTTENIYFDDYKNPPDAYFLTEIPAEEFHSEKYKANYAPNKNPFYSKPPIFNELHEPLSITIPKEVFQRCEEYQDDGYGNFRFGVVPVFYFQEMNAYGFYYPAFGEISDYLTFSYKHYEHGKISITAR